VLIRTRLSAGLVAAVGKACINETDNFGERTRMVLGEANESSTKVFPARRSEFFGVSGGAGCHRRDLANY
jgi:hypothetical protein